MCLGKFIVSILLLSSFSSLCNCHNTHTQSTTTDLRPNQYNPLRRPPQELEDQPVRVKVAIELMSITSVDEFEQTFTADILYRLSWFDYRLRLPTSESDYPLVLDISWHSKLWVPDVYLQNALQTSVVSGFSPISFLEVSQESEVSLVARLGVKMTCDMELSAFPHDRQKCFFDSTSLSYTPRALVLEWANFTIQDMFCPKFGVYGSETIEECPGRTVNNRPCIRAIIKMKRKLSFYITRYYAPTTLIVATTFAGFWLPASAWPARVTVVLTPFLSLVTIHNAVSNEVKVSYVVALHIWMFFCMFATFMGLFEYLLVVIYDNRLNEKKNEKAIAIDEDDDEQNENDEKRREKLNGNALTSRSSGIELIGNWQKPLHVTIPFPEKVDKTEAVDGCPSSTRLRRLALKSVVSKCRSFLKGNRSRKSYLRKSNPVDMVARFTFPLIFAIFIGAYFGYYTESDYLAL